MDSFQNTMKKKLNFTPIKVNTETLVGTMINLAWKRHSHRYLQWDWFLCVQAWPGDMTSRRVEQVSFCLLVGDWPAICRQTFQSFLIGRSAQVKELK
ncbi:hypothetical protein AVEN_81788-1 [Araneus ventricosus]|uniref:Uncharacterized protein n=1 Tax=Araneus ventricosus TaxID=182803 RepID=A0A4Y2L8P6_ARAVE|nr:hypothetical protein AVEN_81788-1 [Araneus ventricosus]